MAFIDKLKKQSNIVSGSIKDGISGAATAVGIVDANKQKLRSLEIEKAKMYEFIGMEVFDLHCSGKVNIDGITPFCDKLQMINKEIDQLESEIAKSDKNCECGTKIQKGVNFCSGCGKKVMIEQSVVQIETVSVLTCVCGSVIENEAVMCMDCGRRVEHAKN